jgi:hypothetical protein
MTRFRPAGRAELYKHVAVGLFFAILTVLMTWPLAAHFDSAVLGPPQDNYYYLSWFAHFRHTLLDLRAPSTFAPDVFYPYGHDYATSETTWANLLLVLPVLLWKGEIVAYNAAVWLSFFLSGLAMYGLLYNLTRNRLAALVSGAVYAFSPYRMAHLGGGQLPLLGTQWLPLCLLCIERALRDKRWRYGLGAGFFYALTALSSWYYAFMAALLLPVYVLVRARPWKEYLRERQIWGAIAAFALVSVVMVGPAIWPTIRLSGQEKMAYSLQFVDRWSASPADYLLPNPVNALWGSSTTRFYDGQRFFYERILALGFAPLLLALMAVAKPVRFWAIQRIARPHRSGQVTSALLWLGGIAFLLSLGTTLHWRGVEPVHIPVPIGADTFFTRAMFNWITRFSLNASEYHWGYELPGHIVLPLPAMLIYLYMPFSNAMRVWSRFGFFVSLAVSILAGLGVDGLLSALRGRGLGRVAVWLGVASVALVLLEYAAFPFPYGYSEVRTQPATEWLRAQPGQFTVIELPLSRALNGPPLYAASQHGKRIAYGYGTFYPQDWLAQNAALARFPAPEALAPLREWGVRYILVAAENFGPTWMEAAKQIEGDAPELRLIAIMPEEQLYHADRWFISTRGTALPFNADTIYVYELLDSR